MLVGREQLETCIAELSQCIRDPRAGIYGPASMSWQVNRESIVFLAGGRAAILQLAHPFVSEAIAKHSSAPAEPLLRFQRTFDRVFAMVFGDFEAAATAARRVHRIHRTIGGELPSNLAQRMKQKRYEANQPEALFWVHATLVDSALQAYETVVDGLSASDKERYYAESKRFARLFGIPESIMPADYPAFQRYCEEQFATLPIAPSARTIAAQLMRPPAIRPPPLARWYRTITAGLLPPRIRTEFGMAWGPWEKAAFRASLPLLQQSYRAMPKRLRFLPAYHNALRRLAGRNEQDPVAAWWEKHVLRAPLGGSHASPSHSHER